MFYYYKSKCLQSKAKIGSRYIMLGTKEFGNFMECVSKEGA